MKKFIPLVLLLVGCSSNNPPPPPPSPPPVGQWEQNCNGLSGMAVAFPNVPPGACYIWTSFGVAPKAGQTLTLNYSVDGDPIFAQNPNSNPTDNPPATIHLLLWRKGDDSFCGPVTKQYRLFAGRTELMLGDNQTLSVKLDPALWPGCLANVDTPAQFDDMLNNLLGVGITFGGRDFAGHGVYASQGTGKFTINSFSVQ